MKPTPDAVTRPISNLPALGLKLPKTVLIWTAAQPAKIKELMGKHIIAGVHYPSVDIHHVGATKLNGAFMMALTAMAILEVKHRGMVERVTLTP